MSNYFLGFGEELELIRENVKVVFTNIGEGYCGDYNPKDTNDENLLRFDVYVKKEEGWEYVEDSSRCTQIAADTPKEELERLLEVLMDNFYAVLSSDPNANVKHLADEMSLV